MKVTIRKEDYESIIDYAKKELPNEACGLIAGIDHEDEREIKKV